jgi:hypothetical protein
MLLVSYSVQNLFGHNPTRISKKCRNTGLEVADHVFYIYTLHFADDQAIIVEDKEDLNYMGRKLQEAYEQSSLIINKRKSEYMIFGNNEKEYLPLEDDHISGVDKRKYLGDLLTKALIVTKK